MNSRSGGSVDHELAGLLFKAVCALISNMSLLDRAMQEKPWPRNKKNVPPYWSHVRSQLRQEIPVLRQLADNQVNLAISIALESAPDEADEILSKALSPWRERDT